MALKSTWFKWLLLLVLVPLMIWGGEAGGQSAPGQLTVIGFHPDKARYNPGDQVELIATVRNDDMDVFFSGPLRLQVRHLDSEVLQQERQVNLGPGETATETFTLTAPDADFTGYLATISWGQEEAVSTGFDVSSTAVRYPRYGYIAEFSLESRDLLRDSIPLLAREYHLNMFQFYDWFWRHENLIKKENGNIADTWIDLFGRRNNWSVIRDLVQTAHDYNALAMAYVMAYAAREDYAELWPISPKWGVFDSPSADNQLSVEFGPDGPFMFLFNPADPGWENWLIPQYVEAVNLGGFDGVHIDQFGPRYEVFGGDGRPVDLPNAFAVFLDSVKEALVENDLENSVCTFNIVDGKVDGWAAPDIARNQSCDFLYSEIWFSTNTYDDLLNYIEYLRNRGGNRALVLAAYSNYNEQIGPIFEAENADQLAGGEVAADHQGYTGTGFVVGLNEPGDSLTWTVDGPEEDANVTYVIRFANATGSVATRNLYLDGRFIGRLEFGARDQWSTWGTDAWAQAVTGPGPHEVRLAFDADNIGAVNIDHLQLGQFDERSVRLENAVMFGSGATHIQLGDNIQSLAHEFYPNRSKSLTSALRRALERQYDFITAYENLLFDPALQLKGDAEDVLETTTGQALEPAEGGRLFTIQRQRDECDILHLVNLIGVNDELWRNEATTPTFQQGIGLRYYPPEAEEIGKVWMATPDFGDMVPIPLEFGRGEDDRGAYVELTVPRLEYWNMLVFERQPSGTNSSRQG
ncbi:MAG: glycoside hydrolase family 66 protein [Syntrophotaleaceae bacterium]